VRPAKAAGRRNYRGAVTSGSALRTVLTLLGAAVIYSPLFPDRADPAPTEAAPPAGQTMETAMSNPDRTEGRLADGCVPATAQDLLARLEKLGITVKTFEHPPVYTVEEAKALRGELPGAHIKNLFLRNKKGVMWLFTCLEDRQIDLKDFGARLGAGRLSFGSAERLMTYLGVEPGAVTPFGVVNDRGGAVTVVLDRALVDQDPVNCHPLVNTMTTALSAAGLVRFLESVDHPPVMIDLDAD
jgi:Ala-tRNA(Pro) deacylase